MRLGLLIRLFTVSNGNIDEQAPSESDGILSWERPIVTRAQFEESLDLAAEIGAEVVEFAQSGRPDAAELLVEDATLRDELSAMVADRGLDIAVLNAASMPMHPRAGGRSRRLIRRTIELAGLMGVPTVSSMSGIGGDGSSAKAVNWVGYPWPAESVALRERHWEVAPAIWRDLANHAANHGVERIALEVHPMNLVYNVPTFQRLREAVGPTIHALIDPSHLFWQGMDPAAVVRALGQAVGHVHLKDTRIDENEVAIAGVLDGRTMEGKGPRAWAYRTLGRGHDAATWTTLLNALRETDYDGALSLEHEDQHQTYAAGVREAAAFVRPILEQG